MLLVLLLFLVGCNLPTETSQTISQTPCEELAKRLDGNIIDTNNPPGRFIIGDSDESNALVGGKLVEISELRYSLDSDKPEIVTYDLAFKGVNKKGILFLRTWANTTLKYKIGEFYQFDLKNINKYSMQLSGTFTDKNQDLLERMEECE